MVNDSVLVEVEAEVDREIANSVAEAFSVDDADSAACVVRRIVAARQYADRVRLWADLERRRAEAEEKRLLFRFGGQLRGWAEGELRSTKGRRKSVNLPGGSIGFRTVPARVLILDDQVVINWARRSCPEAVIVSERLVKTPISEHVQRTGEVPDGIELTTPHEEFFVR